MMTSTMNTQRVESREKMRKSLRDDEQREIERYKRDRVIQERQRDTRETERDTRDDERER